MLWCGEIVKPTGYAEAGRGYLCSLAAVNYTDVGVIPATPIRWDEITPEYAALRKFQKVDLRGVDQRVRVYHNSPIAVAERVAFGLYNIAMTVWETTKLPAEAKFALNTAFEEVWVPSTFNKQAFENSKVRKPIRVIPHALVLPPKVEIDRPAALKYRYVFLCIGSRNARKNPQAVLRSYLKAFHPDDSVALIYKSWSPLMWDKEGKQVAQLSASDEVKQIAKELGLSRTPPVIAIDRPVSRQELLSYYSLADSYVSAHRGEGFGLALLEAKAYGLRVIATNFGGPVDFLDPSVDALVDYKLIPVEGMDFQPGFGSDQQWADPVEDALIQEMQAASASNLAGAPGAIWETHSPRSIGKLMVEAIEEAKVKADAKNIVIGKPQKRLPVTMISTFNEQCGIGVYSELLARALGWRDYPASFYREFNVPPRTDPQMLGFKIKEVGWKRGQPDSVLALLSEQPGILHLQHEFGFWRDAVSLNPIIDGAHAKGWKVVVTLHTVLPAGLAEESLFKAALHADAVIVLGQPGHEAMQAWHTLLANGVSPLIVHIPQGCVDPILLTKDEARKRFSVAAGIVGLHYGFLSKSKRPMEIVEAVSQRVGLADKFRSLNAKLVFAGCVRDPDVSANRGYANRLRAAVKEELLDDIMIVSDAFVPDEDLPALFAASDFAVLNHQPGVLSNSAVLRQLQSYGLPVCAADVPSLSDAKDAGALIHTNSIELGANIERMLTDTALRAELAEKQRAAAMRMPWEEVAGRHELVYMELSR